MRKKALSLLLPISLILGIFLLLYPTISNFWNSFRQTKVIYNYINEVQKLDNDEYNKIIEDAENYNKELSKKVLNFTLPKSQLEKYNSTLSFSEDNVMGYIEISKIDVKLPVYHGTSDKVLSVGVGHIEGSSLPVGGQGSHCVLSGHRGLPSATLFSDLDKLVEGDKFCLNILDKVFTYEVDQIRIVEPDKLNELVIEEDKDYCTLVTCTPYGINSHRLLVRGYRVENEKEPIRVVSDAFLIEPIFVAPVIAVPFIFIFVMVVIASSSRKKNKVRNKNKYNGK